MQFFRQIAWLNIVFISLAGINSVSLLLGKSTSQLISAVLLLIAQFPFTLLAITLGSVTLHQVLAAYTAVLAYMLALGNLGLLCSVCCRTSRATSWLTDILLAGFLFGPSLVLVFLTPLRAGGNVNPTGFIAELFESVVVGIVEASVVHRIGDIMQSRFAEPVIRYQVISNLVAAFVFFGLSWAMSDVFLREQVLQRRPGARLQTYKPASEVQSGQNLEQCPRLERLLLPRRRQGDDDRKIHPLRHSDIRARLRNAFLLDFART